MKQQFQLIAQELMETAKRLMMLADKLPDDTGQRAVTENKMIIPEVIAIEELRKLVGPYLKSDPKFFKELLRKYGVDNITKLDASKYSSFLNDLQGGSSQCVH